MAKGNHRPNKKVTPAKRRRCQREAAAKEKLVQEQNRAKSAIAAAAEPDLAYLERRAMVQGFEAPEWEQPKCVDAVIDSIKNPKTSPIARAILYKALVSAHNEARKQRLGLDKPQPNQFMGVVINGSPGDSTTNHVASIPEDEAYQRINFIAAPPEPVSAGAVPGRRTDVAGEESESGSVLVESILVDGVA